MLNRYLTLICCIALLVACRRSEDNTSIPTAPTQSNAPIGACPSTFTQKVLMEIFTGAGQSQCTDGFVKAADITAIASNTAIPVYIHFSDAMEIPYYTVMESTFNNSTPPAFPSSMINRTSSLNVVMLNRTQWMSNFNVAKSKTAKCGLALNTSVSGTTATIEVHAGFNQTLTGTYKLNVMLLENNVTGNGNQYDQRNGYNTSTGHQYYNSGDPIVGFNHNDVLRKMISANSGDSIPSPSITAGGHYIKTFTVNLGNNYKLNDLYIVAFVDYAGASATMHEVLNAQKVKLGSLKSWD